MRKNSCLKPSGTADVVLSIETVWHWAVNHWLELIVRLQNIFVYQNSHCHRHLDHHVISTFSYPQPFLDQSVSGERAVYTSTSHW